MSEIVSEAERAPLAVGVKVTLIVHIFPAAMELPQVLLWAKSLAFVPVTATLEMLRLPLPLLVTLTVWAVLGAPTASLPKGKLLGERLTPGAVEVPVPDKVTV